MRAQRNRDNQKPDTTSKGRYTIPGALPICLPRDAHAHPQCYSG